MLSYMPKCSIFVLLAFNAVRIQVCQSTLKCGICITKTELAIEIAQRSQIKKDVQMLLFCGVVKSDNYIYIKQQLFLILNIFQ